MLSTLLALSLLMQEPPPKGPADWKVEVLAKYPDIKFPSVLSFAPDGRLFIAEDPMDMEGPVNKPVDRILCIHPDGKVTVFAEGLYAVFGLQYLDGKVYVHHTPKFSVFTDDHGVGKDRVDLIECTNPNPAPGFNDHIPSNCRIAMDGYLYISTGDKGIYGAVGKDGNKAEIHGGGLARMRPDGSDLEVYSTGTRNHLDVAVTSEDELFTYDNTDDGHGWWTRATHMVDGGYYGYPWDYKPQRPYTLWMMADYGGGSGCASIAYNEDALPEKYRGNLFLSDWARKEVLRLDVVRVGATWKIQSTEKFLTGGGGEFRPLGQAVSPDGMSIYICDWNYGGWTAKGKQTGRLIKATYTGGASMAAPKPAWYVPAATAQTFEASTADLIKGFSHSSREVRLTAQRRLSDRKATKELEAVLASGTAPAKWHAIWALDAIGGSPAIAAALKDADASVRRQAARQLGTRKVKEAAEPLMALLQDADLTVQFHAATALGRIGAAAAIPALQESLKGKDLFARYAAFHALNRIGRANSSAWGDIVKGLESPDPAVREGTLFALRDTYEEPLAAALAKAPRSAECIAALAEIHRSPAPWKGQWWGTQPVGQPRPPKVVDYGGTKLVLETLRAALSDANAAVRRAAVESVAATKDVQAAAALRDLFAKEADVDVKKAVLRSLGAIKDDAAAELVASAFKQPELLTDAAQAAEQIAGPTLVKMLADLAETATSPEILAPALGALGRLKAGAPTAAKQIAHADPRVALAAIGALGQIGGDVAVGALCSALEDKRVEIRKAAITSLATLAAKPAVPSLLKAYLDKSTRFEAVAALAATPDLRALDAYLEGLGGKNATLREQCRKAVAAISAPALPLIESKIEATLLTNDMIVELQRVYNKPVPILEWMILGSFPSPCAEPFAVDSPPLSREFKDAQNRPIQWKKAKVSAEFGMVNLRNQMTIADDATAYAVTELESPAERAVQFVAGSDDTMTVWLNGQKIFEDLNNHGWKWDAYHFGGTLKTGKNVVVVKCANSGGGWEFSLAYPAPRQGRLFEAKPQKLDPKAYVEFAKKTAGDAARGRALFSDVKGVACIKCHRVYGEGGEVGPDLTGVGLKYGRDHFIESVLYPSAKILDGYKQTMVLTRSGVVIAGRFLGDSGEELTLMDAEGKRHVVKKSEIDQKKEAELSLMPEGLNTGLSLQDFADIVSFLESLKEAPKK
ncbi:MAG TPA: HEAT repeat domain-containing protein [Planctomycetota bacterium]|nr:HEAT repeat domain-containing protein [Planctomycetota bacterium]